MRKLFMLIIILAIPISSLAQVFPIIPQQCYWTQEFMGGYYPCENYDDWALVFNDEFNGTEVNYEIWNNTGPNGRNSYCAEENFEYNTDDDNFEVSNGTLKIIAKDEQITANIVDGRDWDEMLYCEGEPWGINQQTFDYTSGNIWSKQMFSHGRFEIRCKIPSIKRL